MRFCPECGASCSDDARFCANCGATASETATQSAPNQSEYVNIPPVQQPVSPQYPQGDPYPVTVTHRGFWWLGFIVPVLGLVLHIVWKQSKPRLSRSIGKGALVGAIVGAVGYTVYVIAMVALGVFSELVYYL